jgi:hypothetical protein
MGLDSFGGWLQATRLSMFIRGSEYAYPMIIAFHIVCFALFGGMVMMTDLRLPGWMADAFSVSDVVDRLRVPKRIGFMFIGTCGLLLFIGNPEKDLGNIFFWIELSLLVLVALNSLVFRQTVYRRADELDAARRMPGQAKLAASLSLLLWFGIVCAGRGIGDIVYPLRQERSQTHAARVLQSAFSASPRDRRGVHENADPLCRDLSRAPGCLVYLTAILATVARWYEREPDEIPANRHTDRATVGRSWSRPVTDRSVTRCSPAFLMTSSVVAGLLPPRKTL